MTRVFRRGQLKQALLRVAADVGPANGYVIMQELGGRIGGSWQPSPGAIYPALLALEDSGLLTGTDVDGTRHYEITATGRLELADEPDVIDAAADRAREAPTPAPTIGAVLDRLVSSAPHRDRAIDDRAARRLETRFRSVLTEIDRTVKETT